MTTLSRRAVVLGAATAAGVGALGIEPALAAAPATPVRDDRATTTLHALSESVAGLRATFEAAVGSRFTAVRDGLSRSLRLLEVGDLPGAAGTADAFRLEFDGTLAADGIHLLSAAIVSPVELYIGHVGPDRHTVEAIIDRRTR